MRPIKLRFFHKPTKKMWQVRGIDWEDGEIHNGGDIYQISECDIMQFTGLLDRDGREVYEGDIVEIEPFGYEEGSDNIQKQKYREVVQYELDSMKKEIRCKPFFHLYRKLEVVGNIHENPELLGTQ